MTAPNKPQDPLDEGFQKIFGKYKRVEEPTNDSALLDFVNNPENIAKAAKGSMEKRAKVMYGDDSASTSIEDILDRVYDADSIALKEVPMDYMMLPHADKRAEEIVAEALAAINRIRQADITETEKAYGGCHNCHGKGYATQDSATIGYPDFPGDKGFKRYEHKVIFCDCLRGKQLEAVMLADRQELIARVEREVIGKNKTYESATTDELKQGWHIYIVENDLRNRQRKALTQLKGEKQ